MPTNRKFTKFLVVILKPLPSMWPLAFVSRLRTRLFVRVCAQPFAYYKCCLFTGRFFFVLNL